MVGYVDVMQDIADTLTKPLAAKAFLYLKEAARMVAMFHQIRECENTHGSIPEFIRATRIALLQARVSTGVSTGP
jgi:hypothetical protein